MERFKSTAHNEANINGIAKTVLMPGDPNRARFIAENFLEYSTLVNNVRGVQGHTGIWKDVPVTVMASGMGIPSIGIYSWELFSVYDVDNIIRIGSAGGIQDSVRLKDIVAAQAACTNSAYVSNFGLPGSFAPIADYTLLTKAAEAAKENGVDLKIGNIYSADNFYYAFDSAEMDKWKRMGVLATEMEAAGLYTNAAYFGKRALCLCTISDHLYDSEQYMSPEDREKSLTEMITIALDTAVKMEQLRMEKIQYIS